MFTLDFAREIFEKFDFKVRLQIRYGYGNKFLRNTVEIFLIDLKV